MANEYIIYADESVDRGEYYSNFYGGLLVKSKDLEPVRRSLLNLKRKQNLMAEIKWSKVTSQYLDKYMALMEVFFRQLGRNRIKIRIMFSQNIHIPLGLDAYHHENKYHILYYMFIKHAFGLRYSNNTNQYINTRIYLDKMPDTKERNARFKAYLVSLGKSTEFRNAKIIIKEDQIAEIRSHDHVLLQCLDIVLGSMQFRLNNKHLVKTPGKRTRGSKTIAKEKLYKFILGKIREVYPNFNIGISTSLKGDPANAWRMPYRHWRFVSKNVKLDFSKAKP